MKIYFAGAQAKQMQEILRSCNVTRMLQSYHYMKNIKALTEFDLLMDSGGFTARMKGTPIDVEEYAVFLNENKVQVGFNLDTNDLKETLENQKFLEKYTNTYIIPIYHLSDYFHARELIQDFCSYPFISIGGVAGEKSAKRFKDQLYQYVFKHTREKIMVHGLGITSAPELRNYPWYSVDSTSWLAFGKFGRSSYAVKAPKLMRVMASHENYKKLNSLEVRAILKFEKSITALWAERGVTWDERPLRVQKNITRKAGKGPMELQERRRRQVANVEGSDS